MNEIDLCKNNCGFFGSSKCNGYCSICYKKIIITNDISNINTTTNENNIPTIISEKSTIILNKYNCGKCNKLLTMYDYNCKCGIKYCMAHRYPELHNCTFDYKKDAQQKIKMSNPKITTHKLDRI